MKESFDRKGIECFLPMTRSLVEDGKSSYGALVPAIHNLLFVHSSQNEITKLKMYDKDFASLRYILEKESGKSNVMTVRDKDMNNFIRVASLNDDSVFYLDSSRISSCVGKRVRITAGRFKDVEGTVRRIKRNRHVVVQIEGIAAVAITYVPAEFLVEINS